MYQNKINQSGRSMVEMLGVLAIIGVLSVAGVSGYTTAMNKHRANEILNEASKRAIVVASKIAAGQSIDNNPLAEFTDNEVGGAKFSTTVEKVDDNKFKIGFDTEPSEAVLTQMQNIGGTNGMIQSFENGLTFNNDLTASKGADAEGGEESTVCDNCATGAGPCVIHQGECVPKFYQGKKDTWEHLNNMADTQRCPNGGVWATMEDLMTFGCTTELNSTCERWPAGKELQGWSATRIDSSAAWYVTSSGYVYDGDGQLIGYPLNALCVR